MSKAIKVYGLCDEDYAALQQVAIDRYGKNSVSQLARSCLTDLIHTTRTSPKKRYGKMTSGKSCRLEIKPSEREYAYLKKAAKIHHCTPNAFVLNLVRRHIDQHPILSRAEIDALYQSNYQLLRIGRNLNQIARQLNATDSMNFSSRHVESLLKIIHEHTATVGKMIVAARERQEQ